MESLTPPHTFTLPVIALGSYDLRPIVRDLHTFAMTLTWGSPEWHGPKTNMKPLGGTSTLSFRGYPQTDDKADNQGAVNINKVSKELKWAQHERDTTDNVSWSSDSIIIRHSVKHYIPQMWVNTTQTRK